MAGIIFANRAGFLLASSITASSLSFNVQPGTGSRCPEISGGNYAYMVFKDASGNFEVVRVTGHAAGTDVFTLASTADRGLDGTTARAWLANDAVRMGLPRLALWDIMNGATTDLGSIGGTANAITAATPTGFDAHRKGNVLRFIPILTNTDAPAISLGGRPPRAIYDGLAPAGASALKAGRVAFIYDDGAQYQLINPANLASLNNPIFTGDGVTLPGNAVNALHAVPKQQLDVVSAALSDAISALAIAAAADVDDAINALKASRRGTLQWTTSSFIPAGAARPAGSLLQRADFPDFYSWITTCGNVASEAEWAAGRIGAYTLGTNGLNFRIPLINGVVIKAFHNGITTYEPDNTRLLGSYQADAIRNIFGSATLSQNTGGFVASSGAMSLTGAAPSIDGGGYPEGVRTLNFNAANQVPTALENRVKNITYYPILWM